MIPWTNYADRMVHLWKRKSTGVYYAVWMESGSQRKKSMRTKDRRIANRKLRNFKRDLIAGKVKSISLGAKKSFYPFVEEFLNHISTVTEPSTYELYETALEKAKASWQDILLSHVTPRHIDKLLEDMLKAGLEPATVNKNYRHVKAALNKARMWRYITQRIDFPSPLKEKKKTRRLTDRQLMKVIEEVDDEEFVDCCLFSAYTALRSGEIIRLQWDDVDNPEGYLRISPKQKNKEESWIPINSPARAILERRRSRGGGQTFPLQDAADGIQKVQVCG